MSVLRNFRLLGVLYLDINYLALIPRYFQEWKIFWEKGVLFLILFPYEVNMGTLLGLQADTIFIKTCSFLSLFSKRLPRDILILAPELTVLSHM